MFYGGIIDCDIANGLGVRVSLFVSGCRNHCQGCFQPETWSFCHGAPFDEAAAKDLMRALDHPYVKGLTLLGGDPFEPENQRDLLPLLREIKTRFPEKDVWCYTGATLEQLQSPSERWYCEATDEMLALIDVLVDGPFIEAQKDISLAFRGSSNQRIINLKAQRK